MNASPGTRRLWLPAWLLTVVVTSFGAVMNASPRVATRPQVVMETMVKLSGGLPGQARYPRIARTGSGAVFVAWEQQGSTAPGLSDTFFRYLPAGPDTAWQPPAPGLVIRFAESPALAAFGADEVTLAFSLHSAIETELRRIQYKRWNPETRTWSRARNIPGIGDEGIEPDIAHEPDGTLWAAWTSIRGGGRSPYFAKVRNDTIQSGGTIDTCVMVNPSWPRIAVENNADAAARVHVVWYDDQYADGSFIQHASRAVAGTDWTCDNTDLQRFDIGQARSPVVEALGPDDVCMAWQEGDGPLGPGQAQEIVRYCVKPGDIDLQSDLAARSVAPSLALAPDGLDLGPLVLWEEQQARSLWFGHSTPPVQVQLRAKSRAPDMAFDPAAGEVHAVWVEDNAQGGAEVFYGRWSITAPSPTPSATATPGGTATAGSATATASESPSTTATAAGTTDIPPTTATPDEFTPTPGTPPATNTASPTATPSEPPTLAPTPTLTPTPTRVVQAIYVSVAYKNGP